MKQIRTIIVGLLILLTYQVKAQNEAPSGNWLMEDKGTSKFYFFKQNQKLFGLMYYYKDSKEEFSLIKELNNEYTSIQDIPKNIIFSKFEKYITFNALELDEDVWDGDFIYEEDGEKKEIDTEMKLLSANKLEAKFTVWGFSEKSILTKIK